MSATVVRGRTCAINLKRSLAVVKKVHFLKSPVSSWQQDYAYEKDDFTQRLPETLLVNNYRWTLAGRVRQV